LFQDKKNAPAGQHDGPMIGQDDCTAGIVLRWTMGVMLVLLNCGAASRSARDATVGALEFEVTGIGRECCALLG